MELQGHIIVLLLIFWRACLRFSIVAAPIYIPTDNAQGLLFLYTLANACYFLSFFFYKNRTDKCEVISHGDFDLHFPGD